MSSKAVAILSVSNRQNLEVIATALEAHGAQLVSTSGTAEYLRQHGHHVCDVSELTGMPSMLDGRVKALHPAVFAGLLARPEDKGEMTEHSYVEISWLVASIPHLKSDSPDLTDMDIGGPSMIRAAVKNYENVVLATDPADYDDISRALENNGKIDSNLRRELAHRAIVRLQAYETQIAAHLNNSSEVVAPPGRWAQAVPLRYGENPHQSSTLFVSADLAAGAAQAEQIQGKRPSYTNILDADVAIALASRFDQPAAVVVKHGAPCGVALGTTLSDAYNRALLADEQSAFGGTVGLNRAADPESVDIIIRHFIEAIIAPEFEPEAVQVAKRRPAARLLAAGNVKRVAPQMDWRSVAGGLLAQSPEDALLDMDGFDCVTLREPSDAERTDLLFALQVARYVKSNAVVTAAEGATIGIGGGQSSRVGAVKSALEPVAKSGATSPVLASDAFFPFSDSIELAAKYGVTAIVQQGGAKRDSEVIAAANAAGIAMLFSHLRLFRH